MFASQRSCRIYPSPLALCFFVQCECVHSELSSFCLSCSIHFVHWCEYVIINRRVRPYRKRVTGVFGYFRRYRAIIYFPVCADDCVLYHWVSSCSAAASSSPLLATLPNSRRDDIKGKKTIWRDCTYTTVSKNQTQVLLVNEASKFQPFLRQHLKTRVTPKMVQVFGVELHVIADYVALIFGLWACILCAIQIHQHIYHNQFCWIQPFDSAFISRSNSCNSELTAIQILENMWSVFFWWYPPEFTHSFSNHLIHCIVTHAPYSIWIGDRVLYWKLLGINQSRCQSLSRYHPWHLWSTCHLFLLFIAH